VYSTINCTKHTRKSALTDLLCACTSVKVCNNTYMQLFWISLKPVTEYNREERDYKFLEVTVRNKK